MRHPEFDDQVRTATVAKFLEVADKLAGGQVGFQRGGPCKCGHVWLVHTLWMVRDDEQTAGYISCPEPECPCASTWGLGGAVPPTRCEYGSTIRSSADVVDQCPLPAGGMLLVDRSDEGEGQPIDVPMCTEHLMLMPGA
jgi:hypothetical protein